MTVLNFGSCCIDNVYSVAHFVRPGETLPSDQYGIHPGGKGLNQSIALSYAGAGVRHAGKVGVDGVFLKELLEASGVDTSLLQVIEGPTGHTIIQVTPSGENAILLFGGANKTVTHEDVDVTLSRSSEEYLLLQNETSATDYLIRSGHAKGMRIIFNAAPMTDDAATLPLQRVELLIINEIEGATLAGVLNRTMSETPAEKTSPEQIISQLQAHYPGVKILLTLGRQGAIYADGREEIHEVAPDVEAVDTTGAGDTFTGYFVAGYIRGEAAGQCLRQASRAAGICVTRLGAASSIPRKEELVSP